MSIDTIQLRGQRNNRKFLIRENDKKKKEDYNSLKINTIFPFKFLNLKLIIL